MRRLEIFFINGACPSHAFKETGPVDTIIVPIIRNIILVFHFLFFIFLVNKRTKKNKLNHPGKSFTLSTKSS